MRAMGIDIGTTTVSVILLDSESGELFGSRTISHQAFIEGKLPVNRETSNKPQMSCMRRSPDHHQTDRLRTG